MFSQELCKARIRSFLVTGITLTVSLLTKPQTFIISRSADWDGHWTVDMSCWSNHATVWPDAQAGALSCWKTNGWFLSPNMFLQNQKGFLTMFWHNCLHFNREWSDCQHRGSQWPPSPLHNINKRRHSGTYFSPLLSIPSPSRHNMQVEPWFIGERWAGQIVWYCPVKGSVTPSSSSKPVLEINFRFMHSNTAVDCLTMEPSLDSSFGNWMSKVCNKLLCDLGQWAKPGAFYKPSETALTMGCGLLWATTTWQCLPPTSFLYIFF